MFELRATPIAGCHEIRPRLADDARGRFVKVFHRPAFEDLGLHADFVEDYYSVSRRGVLRGLHFQAPPADHAKLVYCPEGAVFDVVLDLRRGSPSYGRAQGFHLGAAHGNLLHLEPGLAHGFYVLSERAVMVYKTTAVHAPAQDGGVLWSSVDVDWPLVGGEPVVSARDQSFPALRDFSSPFP